MHEEGDTTEHFPFVSAWFDEQMVPDLICEVFVVRHRDNPFVESRSRSAREPKSPFNASRGSQGDVAQCCQRTNDTGNEEQGEHDPLELERRKSPQGSLTDHRSDD